MCAATLCCSPACNNKILPSFRTGAPRKQAQILHSTLLRVLTPVQLPPDVIAAIQRECQQWTQKLRGTRLCLTKAW